MNFLSACVIKLICRFESLLEVKWVHVKSMVYLTARNSYIVVLLILVHGVL